MGHGPLSGLRIIEQVGAGSTDMGRVAVAFAGLLAQRFGATVFRPADAGPDPIMQWPPMLADGSSALHRFLTAGKGPGDAQPGDYLLSDDPDLVAAWSDDRKVLIRPTLDEARPQSDLTVMAASGLLDIVGEVGRAPLALPGYQMGYVAGMVAFNALLASHLASVLGGKPLAGEIAVLEAARWLNWKNLLSEVSGQRASGVGRAEEWQITRCKDGYIAPVFRDRDMPNLARLMREPALLEERFATAAGRRRNLAEMYRLIEAALADRMAQDILLEAVELKLPFAQVQSPEQVAADPQMQHRQFIVEGPLGPMPRLPLLWNGRSVEAWQAGGEA
ncbi:hypothetical protein ASD04_10800 [Devosia sp. Root436]|nr:hypothetical protein ASD04_10800 [Devosia sp. Root436]